MKMKKEIPIFIALFFFLSPSFLFAYSLPLPRNTTKAAEQDMNLNGIPYFIEAYQSSLSYEELTSFYKADLSKAGFILVSEESAGKVFVFSHPQSQENLALYIDDKRKDLINISVSQWKGDFLKPETEQVSPGEEAKEDSPGKDLPGVPRYPESIRISSIEKGILKNASYRTVDEKEEVRSFYETRMPALGWQRAAEDILAKQKAGEILAGDRRFAEGSFLFYTKKNSVCGILIIDGSSGDCSQQGCSSQSGQEGSIIGILQLSKE